VIALAVDHTQLCCLGVRDFIARVRLNIAVPVVVAVADRFDISRVFRYVPPTPIGVSQVTGYMVRRYGTISRIAVCIVFEQVDVNCHVASRVLCRLRVAAAGD